MSGAVGNYGQQLLGLQVTPSIPFDRAGRKNDRDITDSINACDAAYKVVADGNYFNGRAIQLANGLSTIQFTKGTFTGVTTLGNTLTVTVTDSSIFFSQTDVGTSIWIQGAGSNGGDFTSVITQWNSALSVSLADSIPQNFTAKTGVQIMWPCFNKNDVGKTIWMSVGGASVPGQGWWSPAPFITTIAAYVAPNSITLTQACLCQTKNNFDGIELVWGTDNTQRILAAGADALAANLRYLLFSEPGIICAFSIPQTPVVGKLIWVGAATTDSFMFDTFGDMMNKYIIPYNAPNPSALLPRIVGRKHLKRFAATTTPVVVLWGDSMAPESIVAGPDGGSPMWEVVRALRVVNPDKAIWTVDRSVGGASWEWMDARIPGPGYPIWYTVTANSWFSYVSTVPNAAGANVVPDVVILGINGENDGLMAKAGAIQSVINKVRALTADGSGNRPDIILVTNRHHSNYYTSAGWMTSSQQGREFTSMIHRSLARKLGYGCIDYEPLAMTTRDGWNPMSLAVRYKKWATMGTNVYPWVGMVGTQGPAILPYKIRDFSLTFIVNGNNGADALTKCGGGWSIQIGNKWDNQLYFGYDASNNLTMYATTYGISVNSTTAITSGTAALATSGQSSASVTYTTSGNIFTLVSGSMPGITVGQCLLLPLDGYQNTAFRTFIIAISGTTIYMADYTVNPQTSSVGTVRWGGMMFVQNDADAQADILVPGAGAAGGILTTKVSAFTDFQHVTLAANAGTTVAGASAVFCGRICIPLIATGLLVNNAGIGKPRISITIRGDELYVFYKDDNITSAASQGRVYGGPVERFGGQFYPTFWPVANNAANGFLVFYQCYIDEPKALLRFPILTDSEMWGDDQTGGNRYGGAAINHLSALQREYVDIQTVAQQDWAT